ncbi:MAG: class I SAM-dependent methyltransferase, partial [Woeseiaceae bacterium]|nr:class I SAM-dependent methyltransferase [Woeseiaceae bacterium]
MKPPDAYSGDAFSINFPSEMLEDLEDLPNYNNWIVSQFAPALKGRAAEIGAGLGTISHRILPFVDSLDLVEPAPELAAQLREKFASEASIRVLDQTLEAWSIAAGPDEFDGIVLVNVLEHIKDDRAAAEVFHRSLKPGGRLMIFVPALPRLYSKLDHAYGHYRRYTRSTLRTCIDSAGFDIEKLHYVDFAGVFPWWLLNTVLGKTSFHAPSLRFYDRYVVPLTRTCESVLRPPLGKNLI